MDDFTPDELKWFKPFSKIDTVVFKSERGEKDTIVFFKNIALKDSTRNFEQGFVNTNYLNVSYVFTKGSYHQAAIMSDGVAKYSLSLLNASKSSVSNRFSMEVEFIGLIFDIDDIEIIKPLYNDVYYFDNKKAEYSGMNVKEGIDNFLFSTDVGIVEYNDSRGIKWERHCK